MPKTTCSSEVWDDKACKELEKCVTFVFGTIKYDVRRYVMHRRHVVIMKVMRLLDLKGT